MISEDLKEIISQIKNNGNSSFLEAATEEQIEKFEKENDIKFPLKFKEWLLYSDGGDLYLPAGVQLRGVEHNPIIDLEDNDRPDDSFIVVGALASGEPVLFKKNEEKFYIYDHENQELDDDLTYEDFFALIKDLYDLLGIGE